MEGKRGCLTQPYRQRGVLHTPLFGGSPVWGADGMWDSQQCGMAFSINPSCGVLGLFDSPFFLLLFFFFLPFYPIKSFFFFPFLFF